MQGVQRQTCKTDIQESKELVEKVSIRKHNDCSLIVPLMFYTQTLKTLKEENENIAMNAGKNTPVILSY